MEQRLTQILIFLILRHPEHLVHGGSILVESERHLIWQLPLTPYLHRLAIGQE